MIEEQSHTNFPQIIHNNSIRYLNKNKVVFAYLSGSNLPEKYVALVNDFSTVAFTRNYANTCGRFHFLLNTGVAVRHRRAEILQ